MPKIEIGYLAKYNYRAAVSSCHWQEKVSNFFCFGLILNHMGFFFLNDESFMSFYLFLCCSLLSIRISRSSVVTFWQRFVSSIRKTCPLFLLIFSLPILTPKRYIFKPKIDLFLTFMSIKFLVVTLKCADTLKFSKIAEIFRAAKNGPVCPDSSMFPILGTNFYLLRTCNSKTGNRKRIWNSCISNSMDNISRIQ